MFITDIILHLLYPSNCKVNWNDSIFSKTETFFKLSLHHHFGIILFRLICRWMAIPWLCPFLPVYPLSACWRIAIMKACGYFPFACYF